MEESLSKPNWLQYKHNDCYFLYMLVKVASTHHIVINDILWMNFMKITKRKSLAKKLKKKKKDWFLMASICQGLFNT